MMRLRRKLAFVTASVAVAIAIACGPPADPIVAPLTIAMPDAVAPVDAAPAASPSVVVADAPPEDLVDGGTVSIVGPQNVFLTLNFAAFRADPSTAKLARLFARLPLMEARGIDPVSDVDWAVVYGPSLIHTDRDVIVARCKVDDAAIAKAIDRLATSDASSEGPFPLPGFKAAKLYADNANRVVIHVPPKLVVVTPASHAADAAREAKAIPPKAPAARELLRLVVRDPNKQIAIPRFPMPKSMTEARFRVTLDPGAEGDIDIAVDSADEPAALEAKETIASLFKSQNTGIVRAITKNLLGGVQIAVKEKTVTAHIHATREQIDALVSLLESALTP